MGDVVLLSFTAALNPTLLAATTVMLLLPDPKRLMLGYWLGAITVSITLGLLIVFALQKSSVVSTTKKTLSPVADIVLAALFLTLALLLATGRDKHLRERRAKRREGKQPPRWRRVLTEGSARTTFVIGALLTLPGASYLAGLDRLDKLHYSTAATVAVVIGFNVVMLIMLEAATLAFAVAPKRAPIAIQRAERWARSHGREYLVSGVAVIGAALAIKGTVGLVS